MIRLLISVVARSAKNHAWTVWVSQEPYICLCGRYGRRACQTRAYILGVLSSLRAARTQGFMTSAHPDGSQLLAAFDRGAQWHGSHPV